MLLAVAEGAFVRPARAEGEVLDLGACVRLALRASADVARSDAETQVARARLGRAEAARFGESRLRVITGPVNRARGNPVYSPDSKNDFLDGLGPFVRAELDVNLPIYTFGKIGAGMDAAEHGVRASAASADVERSEVILSVRTLYWDLVLARQIALVVKDMVDAFDAALKTAKERLESGEGEVSERDVLELRIGRAQVAAGLHRAESGARLAEAALLRAIGRPTAGSLVVADRRLAPVAMELGALDGYVADAEARRPELRALAEGLAAADAKVALAAAGRWPSLGLGLGLHVARAPNRDEQTNPFAWDELNFVRPIVVLALAWNLDLLAASAELDEAEAERAVLEARAREAKSGLRLDVERAWVDVTRWRETLKETDDGSRAGRALMVSAVSSFELGLGSAEDVWKGLSRYVEIHTEHLRAVHDYNVAVGALSKAVGREITGLEYSEPK